MCIPAFCSSEKQLAISQSRFPSEVLKDKLYIGNLVNTLCHDFVQLKMLGIKHIVYLTPNPIPELEKDF